MDEGIILYYEKDYLKKVEETRKKVAEEIMLSRENNVWKFRRMVNS
ncbi:MAG: hypothetical protein N3F64_05790 [Nitrososphaeria archaeon]|nr:hypothetical protein [Nitrososphaeria archaeon]